MTIPSALITPSVELMIKEAGVAVPLAAINRGLST
jgi:hypothetical protein